MPHLASDCWSWGLGGGGGRPLFIGLERRNGGGLAVQGLRELRKGESMRAEGTQSPYPKGKKKGKGDFWG